MVYKIRDAKGRKQETELVATDCSKEKIQNICVFTDISLVERQWVKIREQADLLGNYFHVFNTLQE